LAHYREKFGFRLLAFCLMDNHVEAIGVSAAVV
jgi:REP element-mobilizing transposase RayT